MQELVKSIGLSLEDEILKEAKQSPYYGIIFDEVTGISIHKQLGLCIQYLGVDGTTEIRNLKLIKVSHGTAEAIIETLVGYLSSRGLILEHLAGGSVMELLSR